MTTENELALDDLPQPEYHGSVAPDELETDGRNPNEMEGEVFSLLCERMEERGWLGGPIIADTDGLIADGEHRWLAAQEIGLTEVPVKQFDLTDEERRIVRQELNKIKGSHDPVRDAIEYDDLLSAGFVEDVEDLTEARDEDLEALLEEAEEVGGAAEEPESKGRANDPYEEWDESGMPEYENEDKRQDYEIKVLFEDEADFEEFIDRLDLPIDTDRSDPTWFPYHEYEDYESERYVGEEAEEAD